MKAAETARERDDAARQAAFSLFLMDYA